jgi:hypothetical protein
MEYVPRSIHITGGFNNISQWIVLNEPGIIWHFSLITPRLKDTSVIAPQTYQVAKVSVFVTRGNKHSYPNLKSPSLQLRTEINTAFKLWQHP